MAAQNTPKPPINVDYFEDLTGDIRSCAETQSLQIGDRIKGLREEKGLTIQDVSQLTGYDESTLEQIEANQLCPQLGAMIRLSKALDSALQRLISDEGQNFYSITRRQDRKKISRATVVGGQRPAYTYMSLAPEVKGRHMEALIVQLEEAGDQERSVHGGEEFIFVLDGMVKLSLGDDAFTLEPGDSAYYLSTAPHVLSPLNGRATILAVIYSR